jgi:hypothetical protein
MLEDRRIGSILRTWLGFVIGLGMITPASASSGDAWQAMRDKLRTGCLSEATAMGLGRIKISADPFEARAMASPFSPNEEATEGGTSLTSASWTRRRVQSK